MNEITKAAATLGKLGGKSKSPAKQQASRANGRKGGRPLKTGYCAIRQHCGDRYDTSFCGPVRATDDEALDDQRAGGYDCTRYVGPDGYLYVDQPDNP